MYWVLDGYYDMWNRWALRQVNALHAAGRMFEERDHVHTLLYHFRGSTAASPTASRSNSPWTTPTAASYQSSSTGPKRSPTRSSGRGFATEHLPVAAAGQHADLVAAFTPVALEVDAPGDVPREKAHDNRTVLLWFLNTPPEVAWKPVIAEHRRRSRRPARAR